MRKDNNFNNASDSEFMKNRAKRSNYSKPKTQNKYIKVTKTIFIVLLVIALILLGVYTYFRTIYKPAPDNSGNNLITNSGEIAEHIDTNTGEKNKINSDIYTFLALGCDKSGGLTDVIMLISYDMKNQKAAIMSIPRDTYVKISSNLLLDKNGNISKDNFTSSKAYATKINGVYAHGRTIALNELDRLVKQSKGMNKAEITELCENSFLGIDYDALTKYINETDSSKKNAAKEKIRKEFGIRYLAVLIYYTFGVPCDYYAQVNISGFRNIVDAIDGVDVYVPDRMYYVDPLQDLYIDIPAGNQHLNGKKAEQFVRFRSGYANADIGRIDAQKIFMTAFIKKLCSPQIVTKLDDITEVIRNNLTTNISVSDALYFATRAIEMDLSNIVMLTLPGAGEYVGHVSYFLIDKEQTIETVNTYLNKYTKPLTEEQFCIEVVSDYGTQVMNPVDASKVSGNTVHLDFLPEKTETEDSADNENKDDENADSTESGDETSDTESSEDDEDSENNPEDDTTENEDGEDGNSHVSYEDLLGILSQTSDNASSDNNSDLPENETETDIEPDVIPDVMPDELPEEDTVTDNNAVDTENENTENSDYINTTDEY